MAGSCVSAKAYGFFTLCDRREPMEYTAIKNGRALKAFTNGQRSAFFEKKLKYRTDDRV